MIRACLLLCALSLGCDSGSPNPASKSLPASVSPASASPIVPSESDRQKDSSKTTLPQTEPPSPNSTEEDFHKDALPLPEAPKADPKSTHTPLQKDNSIILESKPDGTKRVLIQAEVCLREGPLELLVCKAKTKEHEAVLRVTVDAQFIHAALVAAGAKPGQPVQFVDPKTQEPSYRPASGQKIAITIHTTKEGKPVAYKAQEWVRSIEGKKPLSHDWVFAGSRLMKDPDKPDNPPVYTANFGDVISISNFVDAMLEIPVSISSENDQLAYEAATDKIPPLGSKVWLVLEPVPDDQAKAK